MGGYSAISCYCTRGDLQLGACNRYFQSPIPNLSPSGRYYSRNKTDLTNRSFEIKLQKKKFGPLRCQRRTKGRRESEAVVVVGGRGEAKGHFYKLYSFTAAAAAAKIDIQFGIQFLEKNRVRLTSSIASKSQITIKTEVDDSEFLRAISRQSQESILFPQVKDLSI